MSLRISHIFTLNSLSYIHIVLTFNFTFTLYLYLVSWPLPCTSPSPSNFLLCYIHFSEKLTFKHKLYFFDEYIFFRLMKDVIIGKDMLIRCQRVFYFRNMYISVLRYVITTPWTIKIHTIILFVNVCYVFKEVKKGNIVRRFKLQFIV
jgi:hypothetical protein